MSVKQDRPYTKIRAESLAEDYRLLKQIKDQWTYPQWWQVGGAGLLVGLVGFGLKEGWIVLEFLVFGIPVALLLIDYLRTRKRLEALVRMLERKGMLEADS